MPIGKDSIKTRVAKVSAEETAAEAKPAAKKPATKKPAAPKAPKAEAPVAETPSVETAVLANVAPETVAVVIGHDEKKPADKVQIGQKMPNYLL